ncbi:MAG: DUF2213 domain-containing protein, partial [Treponema sp.]|nr:DUF2213 domain-containing protein [Treponema sp.]
MEKTVMGASRTDSFDPGRWMTSPFGETDEGFFQGRAIVTSVGVFTYKNDDGSTTRELRPPEEVFAAATLDSMKGKPVVNDHPNEKVTPENAGKYQVGSIGTDPSSWIDGHIEINGIERTGLPERGVNASDGFHVAVTLTLTDGEAIAEVKAGKTALSMGYT